MFFLRDVLFADQGVFFMLTIFSYNNIWHEIYLIYNIVVSLD